MNVSKIIRNTLVAFCSVVIGLYVAHAQTGNTGGSSGGTGGGQHGEGSGPGINVPSAGGAYFSGNPDANPYATATPHDITAGVAAPAETPKHGKSKKGDKSASTSPSPSR